MRFIKKSFQDFLNLVYPKLCLACGKGLPGDENFLCPSCWLDLPKTNFHNDPQNMVAKIFWGRVPIKNATSFFYYFKGSRYQNLIYEMKYKHKKEIGFEMGLNFGSELTKSDFGHVDYLVPVPLHKKKYRQRGFNQSEWIAMGLSKTLDIPVNSNNLYRSEYTKSQTRKSRHERWKNVENVFKLKNPHLFENKDILLVDDILTTGATLEACSNAILTANGASVYIATLGIADN
jgi:ComF family protein